jgi:lipoprotein LprG
VRRLLFFSACIALFSAACGSSEDLGGEKLPTDPIALQQQAADAMGAVTSVRFTLERTEAPVYIDAAESMSLDALDGRFSAPGSADAILEITVNGSLGTKIGAVAIDDEVWMSNPVTGTFETLPPGFDIDPSLFFDPEDGWRPLIEGLTDVTFIAEEQREGTRYHLTGTAPAADMQSITAGLVRGQDVELDLWLHPVTAQVTAIEFTTEWQGELSDWVLELRDYGESFEITDPTLDV